MLLELGALPLLDDLAAALDAEPVAEVVGQHHAEALEQRVFEEVGEVDQLARRRPARSCTLPNRMNWLDAPLS